jgi:hypothetical protein
VAIGCQTLPPASPATRRPPGVEASDHVDDVGVQAVVDGIRETVKKGSAHSNGNLRESLRQARDQVNDLFKRLDELVAEARTLRVIPFPRQR